LKIGIEIEDFVFEKKYVTEENTVLEQSFIAKPTNAYIERIKETFNAEEYDLARNNAAPSAWASPYLYQKEICREMFNSYATIYITMVLQQSALLAHVFASAKSPPASLSP